MFNKILVLDYTTNGYGKAVEGLGFLTIDKNLFFKKPEEFVLVLFTGGPDVDPSLYGDTSPFSMCSSDLSRDKVEKTVFQHALINNIPMIGICRGFQFLNVMAKGRLMHHINSHAGTLHLFDGLSLEHPIRVNSFHHQMVIPPIDSHTIGWSPDKLSKIYYGRYDQAEEWNSFETEAVIFPKINACGVQYHPEWMQPTSKGFLFFYNMANKLIELSIDDFVKFYTKRSESAETAICACNNNTA